MAQSPRQVGRPPTSSATHLSSSHLSTKRHHLCSTRSGTRVCHVSVGLVEWRATFLQPFQQPFQVTRRQPAPVALREHIPRCTSSHNRGVAESQPITQEHPLSEVLSPVSLAHGRAVCLCAFAPSSIGAGACPVSTVHTIGIWALEVSLPSCFRIQARGRHHDTSLPPSSCVATGRASATGSKLSGLRGQRRPRVYMGAQDERTAGSHHYMTPKVIRDRSVVRACTRQQVPASPREPGLKAEPEDKDQQTKTMVTSPGLPDKRGMGSLFGLARRPDSDTDRRALSLTTCPSVPSSANSSVGNIAQQPN